MAESYTKSILTKGDLFDSSNILTRLGKVKGSVLIETRDNKIVNDQRILVTVLFVLFMETI